MSRNRDVGETLEVTGAVEQKRFDSALASDVNGKTIDRKEKNWPRSMVLYADFTGELGDASDKLTFTVQESSDDSSYSDTNKVVVVSNGAERAEENVTLYDKDRYVRLQLDVSDPVDQSLAADATGSITAVLGGAREV